MLSQLELLAGDVTPFSTSSSATRHRAASSPATSSSPATKTRNQNTTFHLRSPLNNKAGMTSGDGLSVDVSPATGNSKASRHAQQQHHFFDENDLFNNTEIKQTRMNNDKKSPSAESQHAIRPDIATSLSPSFDQVRAEHEAEQQHQQQQHYSIGSNTSTNNHRSPSYFSSTRNEHHAVNHNNMRASSSSVSPQPTAPSNTTFSQHQQQSSPSSFVPNNFSMTTDDNHDSISNFVTPSSVHRPNHTSTIRSTTNSQQANEDFLSTMLVELQTLNEKNRVLIDEKSDLIKRAERAEAQLDAARDETERVRVHHKMLQQTSLELQQELTSTRDQLDASKDEIQRLIREHADEKNELCSRLAREEAFACNANSELHVQQSALDQFRKHEQELRAEVDIAHDQMMEMAKEFDETKSKMEGRITELRSFVSDLQIRVEEAESEARSNDEKRRHAEDLLINLKNTNNNNNTRHHTPNRTSSSSSLKEQHQKKISDLETALHNQQEEHRKRMKRQIKLEAEIDQLKTSLHNATQEVEKTQHRYQMIVSPLEHLVHLAVEIRDNHHHHSHGGERKSMLNADEQEDEDEKSRQPSLQALLSSNDDSDSDEDSSSSDDDENENESIHPGDSLLIVDCDDDNTSVESAPSSVPSVAVDDKKTIKKKKTRENKKQKKSNKKDQGLPPVHPSSSSTKHNQQRPSSVTSTSSNTKATRSVSVGKSTKRATSRNNFLNSKSSSSSIEATPLALLKGSNPLFQIQFASAIFKKLLLHSFDHNSSSHSNNNNNEKEKEALRLLERQQKQCKSLLEVNDELKHQIKDLKHQLSAVAVRSSHQDQVLRSEHEHAIKERESAASLAEQLQQMTEDLVAQTKEKSQFEAAVKNLTNRLEQQTFELHELKCKFDESVKTCEKLQSQITKMQSEKQASDVHHRRDRENTETIKKELETLKRSTEEQKEKFEKHKELLQNSLRKEQRRYAKALQHADKLEAKFIAAQTEIGSLTSKLKSSENDLATKLLRIQSLERTQKESSVRVQKTEAKLSQEDEMISDFVEVIGQYDRALSCFSDIVYRNTEYRCVPWDLTLEIQQNNSIETEELLERSRERSQVCSKFLKEFADFTLLHLKLLEQAEISLLMEREKVEFLNSELEVYLSQQRNQQQQQQQQQQQDPSTTNEVNPNNNSDLSLIDAFIKMTPSPAAAERSAHKESKQTSSSSSKKKSSSSSKRRRKHHHHHHHHHHPSPDDKHVNDSDLEDLETLSKTASPPRSLFL